MGISLTGDNCHRNICSGSISLGMIQHSGIGIICKFILVSALVLDFHSLLLLFVSVCGKLENTISYVHKSQHACVRAVTLNVLNEEYPCDKRRIVSG